MDEEQQDIEDFSGNGSQEEAPPATPERRIRAPGYDDLVDRPAIRPRNLTAPPPMEMPFGEAEAHQLQKLQGAMTSANTALYDGEIDTEAHADYLQQIQQRMAPLLARQEKDQAQQEQKQQQQAMKQRAMVGGMDQHDAEFRAQNIHKRVGTYTDPITGKTAHFIEKKPGQIDQIDWPDERGDSTTDSGGMVGSKGEPGVKGEDDTAFPDDFPDRPRELYDDVPDRPGELEAAAGGQNYPPGKIGAPEAGSRNRQPNPHDLMITINGIGYDRMGNPMPQKESIPGGGTVNNAELHELRQRAERAVPMPTGTPLPGQPRLREREKRVNELHMHLVEQRAREKRDLQLQQAASSERQRHEGAASTEAKRKETAQADEARAKAGERQEILRQKQEAAQTVRRGHVGRHLDNILKDPNFAGASKDAIRAEAKKRLDIEDELSGYKPNEESATEKPAAAAETEAPKKPYANPKVQKIFESIAGHSMDEVRREAKDMPDSKKPSDSQINAAGLDRAHGKMEALGYKRQDVTPGAGYRFGLDAILKSVTPAAVTPPAQAPSHVDQLLKRAIPEAAPAATPKPAPTPEGKTKISDLTDIKVPEDIHKPLTRAEEMLTPLKDPMSRDQWQEEANKRLKANKDKKDEEARKKAIEEVDEIRRFRANLFR